MFRDLVRVPATEANTELLGAAGAASAISVIFGMPLVAAVLLMEVSGVGGPQLFAVMLPVLLAGGIGAIVFTGFGHWTGLKTGSLEIGLPAPSVLDAGDVVWSVLMAVVIGAAIHWIIVGGRIAARLVVAHPLRNTVLCALGAAVCAALYAVLTGRSPSDVALSGQSMLGQLATDPHAWSVGSLVAVLVFKSVAYALCLGSLRGGPVFPALFLGGATGALLAPLPGLGVVPGVAAGMAASSAAALPAAGQLCGAGRADGGQLGHGAGDRARRRGVLRDHRTAVAGAGNPGVQRWSASSASSSVVAAMISERWVKGLREVAQLLPAGTDLLGEQADVVRVRLHLLEGIAGLGEAPRAGEGVDVQEGAQTEECFFRSRAVRRARPRGRSGRPGCRRRGRGPWRPGC